MPSLFQLLIIAGVALVVLVLWRSMRASSAGNENTSTSRGRYERRKRQRRMHSDRRSTIRLERDRRQGYGRRAEDAWG